MSDDDLVGVSCCKCANFIPDTMGDGVGLGQCKVIVWLRDHQPKQEDHYYKFVLGNRAFWGGNDGIDDRNCERFKTA